MTPESLWQLLNRDNWASTFDERTLQRGEEYSRRRRVTRLEFSTSGDDAGVLKGTVAGSKRQAYRCDITVNSHDRGLTTESHCNCPIGTSCKHAAALLFAATATPPAEWPEIEAKTSPLIRLELAADHLAVLQRMAAGGQFRTEATALLEQLGRTGSAVRPPGVEMREWDDWLRTLHGARASAPSAVDTQRQFGILLRGADTTAAPRLLANPVWLRPGRTKAATLVDPQPVQLNQHGVTPAPKDGWPDGVEQALSVLLPRPEHRIKAAGQVWTKIDNALAEQALRHLLEHYPVYHERGAARLRPSDPLALTWQWQPHEDGSQQLHASVDDAVLLRGHTLWYVQPQSRRFGRVDGDAALVSASLHAPRLQPAQAEVLQQRLQRDTGTAALPAPQRFGPVQALTVAPVPVLDLRVVRGYDGALFGCARLQFDYGPLRLPSVAYPNTVRRLHEGQLFEVHRDATAERRAMERLRKAGFADADECAVAYGVAIRQIAVDDLFLQPNRRKPPWSPGEWQATLVSLLEAGFRMEYAADFPNATLVDIDAWHAELEPEGNQWFEVSLGIDVAGERIDLLPVLRRLLADPTFPMVPPAREKSDATWRVPLDANRSVEIALQRLRTLIGPLLEWLEGDGALRLHRSQAPLLAALDEHVHWRGGDLLRKQMEALQHASRDVEPPPGFKATLRPYQRAGLAWLDFLGSAGLGGILADDMGLGKTVQVLAHLLGEKQRGRLQQPALVVAPTSLVGNWQSEAARFAPTLKVLVIHGAGRGDRYDEIAAHDLIITTYPLLPRDRERLLEQRFALLILDEAQAIKNANSQAARVVREIRATRRLAMTGTPLENHLGELWAQFDAVEPGLLGSQRQFTKLYRTPIEKHADADRQQRLNRRVGPLLLRRRKDDVLTDLPAKTEIVRMLELEGDQRELYETLRLAQHARVQQAIKQRGLAQSGIIVLDALLKLRQVCCDPRLVKLPSAKKVTGSAKLDALFELLDGLLGEGRRVLLFSQFTEMLALIEAALVKRGIAHQILTGQTPAKDRSALVKRFQDGAVPVFLISLKAGGVGLNLTAADSVIHYDPWWNPAVEAQATDRAHRIGQDKRVFVYRLICAGTVEEKIQAMQARKADLARAVLEGGGATVQLRFNEDDLGALFAPM